MEVQYPWEAEEQAAKEEHFEEAAENGWQSAAVAQAHVDEIRRYGLDCWIYFRFLRALAGVFVVEALLVAPKLAVLSSSSGIQQREPLAWLARVSLGNASPGHLVEVGPLALRIDASAVLGIFDALQWVIILVFCAWFLFWRLPRYVEDPELRPLSAADYAVQVDGLPRHLPEDHHQYEMELIRHFEAVLRELKGGDPHARIYEAALVRDFARGLYAAQQIVRLEAELRGTSGEDFDRDETTAKPLPPKTERRLKGRLEDMKSVVESSRMEEAERPVKRAYIICSSKKERADLLWEYRFTRLPVFGRCWQSSGLRLYGRWPLIVSAAPEPEDIRWAHFGMKTRTCAMNKVITVLFAGLLLLVSAAACWGLWWAVLGVRGESAVQCSTGYPQQNAAVAVCLSPPQQNVPGSSPPGSWERGCDCVCAERGRWLTDSGECETLGMFNAIAAVAACVFITECAHRLLLFFIPMMIERWHHLHGSDVECSTIAILSSVACLVPFSASLGHFLLKLALLIDRAPGLAEPLLWEVDRGWYLHGAPVIILWCLFHWLGPVGFALVSLCSQCRGRARVKRDMVLRTRYVTLVTQVTITVALQPLLPILVPFAALGLVSRLWIERSAFLRGQLVRHQDLSFPTTRRMVSIASTILWAGVVGGSALATWVLGERALAGTEVKPKHSFLSRGMTSTAIPAFAALCVSFCAPVILSLFLLFRWLCEAPSPLTRESPGAMNYQEAWLIMTHRNKIATYQLRDMPGDHGGSVLDSLEDTSQERGPQVGAPSYLTRMGDVTASLAEVGDKAPTRGPVPKTPARDGAVSKTPTRDVKSEQRPETDKQQAEYWSQLRSVATVSPEPLGRNAGEASRREAT